MMTPKRFRMVQVSLFVALLVVGIYFVAGFLHFSNNAAELDAPLRAVWEQLQKTGVANASGNGIDLAALEAQRQWLLSQRTRLEKVSQTVSNRLAFEPAIQQKIQAPFMLFEYQNERQLRIEELEALASEKHVALDPAVGLGFPEYSAEQKRPELLWGQLALAHYVLEAAIQCQVAGIKGLSANPPRSVNGEDNAPADELSVNVELTGPSPVISRLLLCLALRADEARALGLPAVKNVKPAFFVDRVLLRKDSAQNPDSIKAELRVTTLVYRTRK